MTYEDIFNEKSVEEAKKRIQDLSKAHLEALEEEFANNTRFLEKNSKHYQEAYFEFERRKTKLSSDTEKKIADIQRYYLINTSAFRRRQLLRNEQEILEEKIRNAEKERDAILSIQEDLGQELTVEQNDRLEKLKKGIEEYLDSIDSISEQIEENDKKIEESDNKHQKKRLEKLKKYDEAYKRLSKAQLDREKDSAKTKERLQKDLNKAEDLGFFSRKKAKVSAYMRYGLSNLRDSVDVMSGENGFETAKNVAFEAKENLANIGSVVGEQVGGLIKNKLKETFTGNAKFEGINAAIQDVTSHRTRIMARLQGVDNGKEYDYAGLMDTVSKNLAVSPYVTQKAFMQKLDEAVDRGIAYNVEQRAFLSTIKDDIATTFDAFDSNLMRIIKLQQADSTAARLGMEAALTKTLNGVFKDSSYLTDEVYKNVRSTLVETESTMTREMSTEFEYVVQKWMGALYSLGASNELINQVAQGLNYIGTGNVQALANNAPLQTLFAMSASRANNVDYADLLVGGLTTEKTNELLKSMVEYLKEIAEDNRNNNVVKSAYGDIYKMSLADMRAITSLTERDISSIYSQNMSYKDMGNELSQQFSNISKRLSMSEMIKNVTDNFIYSLGSEITQNAASYVLWQITDMIQNETGGIHLPAISVFGNMVDLSSFTIEGMMKTGLVGLATLGQIGNIFSSIGNKGGLSLSAWNYTDTLQRGQIETQTAGSISTTSGSTYVGSSSSSDMKNSSIASATEDAGEVSEITNADNESEYTFDDWYKSVLIDKEPIYTKSGEEFSVSDLYETMYRDRVPVPVEISPLTKLGSALDALATYLLNAHRITDVNIKKSDIFVPVTVQDFESKFKNEIRNYIKSVYIETLSQELKENLIGNTRGASSATIAKVCDKILNDKVDVMVENDGFDLFLANSYALHG